MTKKDFIALADIIRRENYSPGGEPYKYPPFNEGALNALADFCQSQNPAFNRSRWLDYIAGKCGPNGGKPKS